MRKASNYAHTVLVEGSLFENRGTGLFWSPFLHLCRQPLVIFLPVVCALDSCVPRTYVPPSAYFNVPAPLTLSQLITPGRDEDLDAPRGRYSRRIACLCFRGAVFYDCHPHTRVHNV